MGIVCQMSTFTFDTDRYIFLIILNTSSTSGSAGRRSAATDLLILFLSPAGTQPSIWMMNQPTRLSRACCSRTKLLLLLLASHPAGGRRHSPDWCRCTECFWILISAFFNFITEKELQLRPSFIMQNATAIMNVFFCAKKMLLRCNVFDTRPFNSGS